MSIMTPRVLLIDDEEPLLMGLAEIMKRAGYNVLTARDGLTGLSLARQHLPDLIICDVMMPAPNGFELRRQLAQEGRTENIPFIFLTARAAQSDKLQGFESGADDYITKPFDIEELKLRVRTAIRTHQRLNMTDPKTGLPSGRLIEDQLRDLMRSTGWTLILTGIDHLGPFNDVYGFVAGDEVLRFAAMVLNQVVDQKGTLNDFIGHASNDTFLIITKTNDVGGMVTAVRDRFNEGVKSHYNFIHREQGGIELPDGTLSPLMRLSIGVVSDKIQRFTDIREITETAAEFRRQDQTGS